MDTDPTEGTRMTLGEHLAELQTRLIRSTVVLLITFAVGWTYHENLATWFFKPYQESVGWLTESLTEKLDGEVEAGKMTWDEAFTTEDVETRELTTEWVIRDRPKGDSASAGFFFYMRVSFYFALFFGGPYILWQLWQFVAAGLYDHEKRVVNRYFPFSMLLFLSGVIFGYLLLVPYALFFLADAALLQVEYYESIDTYASFLTSLTLALGVVFQLPVLMIAMSHIGLVKPATYAQFRPHCIVAALILAAVLTPPDPFTQMLMAGPMIVLYEVGHLLSRLVWKTPIDEDEADLEGAEA
ncbi:MAG: sec-independent protein translocase protein TatC [Planctomycetota bacterium]|jgi:sec-independent protein translocase protein TatC